MTGVLGRGRENTDTRRPPGDGGTGWRDVVTSQGRLEPLEAGRGREDLPLEPPKGVGHWDT